MVRTPDHILCQEHQVLREAGTKSGAPVSHHALQQHLGTGDGRGPSCAEAPYRPATTVLFSRIILRCQYAGVCMLNVVQ